MYIKDSDKTKHHITAIRPLFPHMGIPDGADLSAIGYLPFVETAQPVPGDGQTVIEAIPVKVGGTYEQRWQVVPMTAEQLADQQAATVAQYEQALDSHLDAVAKSHRFPNGRHALALRAGYPNYWQALGAAFGTWMDQCNVQAATLLQSVLAGQAQKPTLEAFIADLPAFEP